MRFHVVVGEFNTNILNGLIVPLPRNFLQVITIVTIHIYFSNSKKREFIHFMAEMVLFCVWLNQHFFALLLLLDLSSFDGATCNGWWSNFLIFFFTFFFPRSPFFLYLCNAFVWWKLNNRFSPPSAYIWHRSHNISVARSWLFPLRCVCVFFIYSRAWGKFVVFKYTKQEHSE